MNAEVERLLELASQVPAGDRSQFLDKECRDGVIRAEVESLLQYYTASESLFDATVQAVARSVPVPAELSPGDLTGPYRIVSLIGRGGMGAVYLAKRADGAYDQDVAIKVVQSVNAAFLLDRFERERRILALLNHPNIGRILDGGQGPNGLPYFAMEYVEGEPIDAFCAKRAFGTRERLKLILKVCDAVEHAHGRLVVHRDLKPANVLVTTGGEPKLLDFGIAKVIDPTTTETGSTRLLTPEYASPEQIRGEPVTTAADIYSLGAVLYKMLTGHPPHRLEGKAPLEAARMICEQPVEAPSTVSPGLSSDVDAILQKALHNDPARRYASVRELSSDIRRFLEGRPVLAAPDSFTYRAKRFLKRNALVSSISALAVASLLAGSAVAINQARRAQRRFDQVRQLAHVFLFDFDRSIQDVNGTLEARKLVASTAQKYLQQLQAESGGDVALEREIAESYERLGDIQNQLAGGGGSGATVASYRRAYEIRRRLGDGYSPDGARRRDFIALASTLADRYQMSRNAKEAAIWTNEALRLAKEWVSAEPRRREALEAAGAAFLHEGLRLETAGESERARSYMEKGVDFDEKARAAGPPNPQDDLSLARAEFTLANMLLTLKRPSEGLLHAQRSLTISEQLHRSNPANPRWRRAYGLTLSSVGMSYDDLSEKDPSKLPLALDYLRRTLQVSSDMVRDDPKSSLAKDDLIVQIHRYTRVLRKMHRWDEAAMLYQQAEAAARWLANSSSLDRRNWYLLAANQTNYGTMQQELGQFAMAQKTLASADEPMQRALEFDPLDATLLELRASQLAHLAEVADHTGNRAGAQQKMRECLDVITGMVGRDASAKEYIGEYKEMLALAQRLGVPTDLR